MRQSNATLSDLGINHCPPAKKIKSSLSVAYKQGARSAFNSINCAAWTKWPTEWRGALSLGFPASYCVRLHEIVKVLQTGFRNTELIERHTPTALLHPVEIEPEQSLRVQSYNHRGAVRGT